MDDSTLREKAREAIENGKLPTQYPERIMGGPGGEVLSLLDNETGMHSCLEPKTQASPVGAGGKRRHPRGDENTGLGADKPEAQ